MNRIRTNWTLALTLSLLSAHAAGAIDLNGGTVTFTFPETLDTGKASITVTNKTGDDICDFIIRVVDPTAAPLAPPFNIVGANVRDPAYPQPGPPAVPAENWDVDDDENGTLEPGETDESQGAPPDPKVRIEERDRNQCIPRGRSATIDLDLSAAPQRGNEIKISPTSAAGGVIFNTATPGCATVAQADVLFPTGRVRLTNTTAVTLASIPFATDIDVFVESAKSTTHGGYFEPGANQLVLDKPLRSGQSMLLDYELSSFNPEGGLTTVCFAGAEPVEGKL